MKNEKINHKSSKDLIEVSENKGVLALLVEALKQSDAITTGAFGTKKLELLMIPGRLVQAARNKKFIDQLSKEIEELKQKGAIKDEFLKSEQAQSCLQELLSALENPPVDEVKFNLLKSIFIKAAKEEISSSDDSTPQLLMNLAKDMTSGEVLLLAAAFKLGKNNTATDVKTEAQKWLWFTAQNSELKTTALVEFYEKKLIEKRMMLDRKYSDRSQINFGGHYRLTDLGIELCRFFVKENSE